MKKNYTYIMIAGLLGSAPLMADNVINDDLIVDGSACIGQDCVNGESFGFDTIRLKENNLRIKFDDTSSSASFPSNDWQLTANDSANGGANKFSIDDITGGRTPFTIEASAPSNSLYVDDGGRVGLGTSNPVVELHVVNGDSPTLRLEQDGSSGFTAQTWDIAGNEANFFVRDVTNGSKLPFRIIPSAPQNSLYINTNGNIGFGTASPSVALDVKRDNTTSASLNLNGGDTTQAIITNTNTTQGGRTLLQLENFGNAEIKMINTVNSTDRTWILSAGSKFVIKNDTTNLLSLDSAGNLIVLGTHTTGTPDYVFESKYNLMPLNTLKSFIKEKKHLPSIPSVNDVITNGHNITQLQFKLLEKVEELTLYTIKQDEEIKELTVKLNQVLSQKKKVF